MDSKIDNYSKLNPRITSYNKADYADDLLNEYKEMVFTYGYVILFGVSAPISFVFALLQAYLERFVDSYKLMRLNNVNIIGK